MKLMKAMKLGALIVVAALATGCASPAQREAMVLRADQVQGTLKNQTLRGAISVAGVTGGKKTNPLWTAEIDDAAFSAALGDSLRVAGLGAADAAAAPYSVQATLLSMKEPFMGFDMKVTTAVNYKLVEKATGKVLFNDTVSAEYTATTKDAFVGTTRLRMAKEGSLRENFKGLIAKIYAIAP